MNLSIHHYPVDVTKPVELLTRVVDLNPEDACQGFIQELQARGVEPGEPELSARHAFVMDTLERVLRISYGEPGEEPKDLLRPWAFLQAWIGTGFPILVDNFPATVTLESPGVLRCDFAQDDAQPTIRLKVKSINDEFLIFNPRRILLGDDTEDWAFITPGYGHFAEVDAADWPKVRSLAEPYPLPEEPGQLDTVAGRVAVDGQVVTRICLNSYLQACGDPG